MSIQGAAPNTEALPVASGINVTRSEVPREQFEATAARAKTYARLQGFSDAGWESRRRQAYHSLAAADQNMCLDPEGITPTEEERDATSTPRRTTTADPPGHPDR